MSIENPDPIEQPGPFVVTPLEVITNGEPTGEDPDNEQGTGDENDTSSSW